MRGFVKDYTVWIHHMEKVVTEANNYRDACIADLTSEMCVHKQGCGGGDVNDDGGGNGGGGYVRDEDEGDYLKEIFGP